MTLFLRIKPSIFKSASTDNWVKTPAGKKHIMTLACLLTHSLFFFKYCSFIWMKQAMLQFYREHHNGWSGERSQNISPCSKGPLGAFVFCAFIYCLVSDVCSPKGSSPLAVHDDDDDRRCFVKSWVGTWGEEDEPKGRFLVVLLIPVNGMRTHIPVSGFSLLIPVRRTDPEGLSHSVCWQVSLKLVQALHEFTHHLCSGLGSFEATRLMFSKTPVNGRD